jgi:hypothetical protein
MKQNSERPRHTPREYEAIDLLWKHRLYRWAAIFANAGECHRWRDEWEQLWDAGIQGLIFLIGLPVVAALWLLAMVTLPLRRLVRFVLLLIIRRVAAGIEPRP